jgi:hypothetical protein
LSDTFPIQNGLKQGDALQFCLRIRVCHQESPRNLVGLELNGTHQLFAYADDVNLLGSNVNIKKENTEILLDVSRDTGIEINTEKTKYMIMFRHQNSEQIQNVTIANE